MGSITGEGANGGLVVGSSSSDTLRKCYERVPRGRCQPPIAPAPDPRRGEMMKNRYPEARHANRGSKHHPSQVVMMSKGGRDIGRKPMPKWKRGYVGFKRKVITSRSAVIPLCCFYTFVFNRSEMCVCGCMFICCCRGNSNGSSATRVCQVLFPQYDEHIHAADHMYVHQCQDLSTAVPALLTVTLFADTKISAFTE